MYINLVAKYLWQDHFVYLAEDKDCSEYTLDNIEEYDIPKEAYNDAKNLITQIVSKNLEIINTRFRSFKDLDDAIARYGLEELFNAIFLKIVQNEFGITKFHEIIDQFIKGDTDYLNELKERFTFLITMECLGHGLFWGQGGEDGEKEHGLDLPDFEVIELWNYNI